MDRILVRCVDELDNSGVYYFDDTPIIGNLYVAIVVTMDGIPGRYDIYHPSGMRIGILVNDFDFHKCFKNVSEYREEQINKIIYDTP